MTGVPAPPAGTDLAALEATAVRAAVSAGRVVRDERPDVLDVAGTKVSVTDVVTVMDRRSEEHLTALLSRLAPRDAVHGEEGAAVAGTSGLTWVVDPIDGTVNYLYRIGWYAVSVACVVGDPAVPGGWRPVAGAVHAPESGQTWSAALGLGARLTDGAGVVHPVATSGCTDLGQALVGTGFGYAAERRARQAEILLDLLPRVRDIRRLGSAAIDLCLVASGLLDGYYETGLNAWDLAAGWLVVTEAGGLVGGLDDRGPTTDLVWAAAPGIADELSSLATSLTAARRP